MLKISRKPLRNSKQKLDCKVVYNVNIFVRNWDVTLHTILECYRFLVFFQIILMVTKSKYLARGNATNCSIIIIIIIFVVDGAWIPFSNIATTKGLIKTRGITSVKATCLRVGIWKTTILKNINTRNNSHTQLSISNPAIASSYTTVKSK